MPHDIFISYSRRDLAAVKPIKEELESLGFSCWMDLEGIESGSPEFTEKIAEAIDGLTAVLFFLSTASQGSRWSLNELRVARDHGKHLVLVRIDDARMDAKFQLEFGGSDIIDWRVAEQRRKLLKDLEFWKADVPDRSIETAGAKPTASKSKMKIAGRSHRTGRGCTVTIAVSFLLVAVFGVGIRLSSERMLHAPLFQGDGSRGSVDALVVACESSPRLAFADEWQSSGLLASRPSDSNSTARTRSDLRCSKEGLIRSLSVRGDWAAVKAFMEKEGIWEDFELANEVSFDHSQTKRVGEWLRKERGYVDADFEAILSEARIPRTFTRLGFKEALERRGLWKKTSDYIKEVGMWETFTQSVEIKEDHPLLELSIRWLKTEGGCTDEDVQTILTEAAR